MRHAQPLALDIEDSAIEFCAYPRFLGRPPVLEVGISGPLDVPLLIGKVSWIGFSRHNS